MAMHALRWLVALGVLGVLGTLAGCGTAPTGASPQATPGAVEPTAPPQHPSRLDIERDWLKSWFQGTPVVIVRQGAGLRVEVPLVHAFEPGQQQVKPALGAVLDKVAESLRRNPRARLQRVAAPGDGSSDVALAIQRATQVRAHLRSRGVPDARLGSPSRTTVAAVQLRLEEDPS